MSRELYTVKYIDKHVSHLCITKNRLNKRFWLGVADDVRTSLLKFEDGGNK